MITRILALVIAVVWAFVSPVTAEAEVHVISADESAVAEMEWAEFHAEAFAEHADAFTALFNSYETKVAKNGRMMIRQGDSGSFKFARKA